jgi:hypothetical protein
LRIEKITFEASQPNTSQYCLSFAALRDSLISDCNFFGWTSATATHTGSYGISLAAPSGDYSGDLDIQDCNFQSHYVGIGMSGSNTTVRITNCTFTGNQHNTYSIGVDGICSGVVVQGCSFYGWGIGIYYQGAYLRQVSNYFEATLSGGADWWWVNGGQSGNSINNCSICDINPGTGVSVFPSGQGCYVVGPTY